MTIPTPEASQDTSSDGQETPRWFAILLTGMAICQVGIAASMIWRVPEGWTTILGMPLPVARLAAEVGCGLLAAGATLCWIRPGYVSRILNIPQWLWRTRIAYALLAGGAGVAGALFVSYYQFRWPGFPLLAAQIGLAQAAIYLSEPGNWHGERRLFWLALPVSGIVVGLALRYWLMRVGVIWTDEAYRLSAIANWNSGNGLTPIMAQYPPQIFGPPWRGNVVALYGLWLRLTGFGLDQLRMFSYLMGLATLPVVYLITVMLYDRQSALVTTSMTALSLLFQRSAIGREDAGSMLLLSIALLAHVYACRRQGLWLHGLAGLAGGLALEGHLTNLSYFVAAGGYYLVMYIQGIRKGGKWLRVDPLWFFAGGGLIALGIYALIHLALMGVSVEGFVAAISTGTEDSNFASGGAFAAWRLDTMVRRLIMMWAFSVPEGVLIVLSLWAALVRRSEGDRHWLLLFAFMQVGYLLVEINGTVRHTLYGLAIWLGGSGALLVRWFSRKPETQPIWGRVGYSALLVAMIGFAVGYTREQQAARQYADSARRPIADYITVNVSDQDWIIAPAVYYVYTLDHSRYLRATHPIADKAPALLGVDSEAYWMDILLETWPIVHVESRKPKELEVVRSYLRARHTYEAMPLVWRVGEDLTTSQDGYCASDDADAPQMIAFERVEGDTPVTLWTIWIVRADGSQDYSVHVAMTDQSGQIVSEQDVLLSSGWAGTPTSEWVAYTFHDVALPIAPGEDALPGIYTVKIDRIMTATGDTISCNWETAIQIMP